MKDKKDSLHIDMTKVLPVEASLVGKTMLAYELAQANSSLSCLDEFKVFAEMLNHIPHSDEVESEELFDARCRDYLTRLIRAISNRLCLSWSATSIWADLLCRIEYENGFEVMAQNGKDKLLSDVRSTCDALVKWATQRSHSQSKTDILGVADAPYIDWEAPSGFDKGVLSSSVIEEAPMHDEKLSPTGRMLPEVKALLHDHQLRALDSIKHLGNNGIHFLADIRSGKTVQIAPSPIPVADWIKEIDSMSGTSDIGRGPVGPDGQFIADDCGSQQATRATGRQVRRAQEKGQAPWADQSDSDKDENSITGRVIHPRVLAKRRARNKIARKSRRASR